MIFIERYADILEEICGDLDSRYNNSLLSVMMGFNEPSISYPNRYNYGITYQTDAFTEACNKFNRIMKTDNHMGIHYNIFDNSPDTDSLSFQPIYYIFSIIELQYIELSTKEAEDFSVEINTVFSENNLPWLLVEGKIVKIDSKQFECDLKLKALETMKALKDAEPKFKSAYNELATAIEAFEKKDYQSAINNASKSYESILKVILGVDRGNADKLTSQYMDQLLEVPDTMTKAGFREKVLMSLPHIRNKSGVDHGAGAKEVVISKPMAKLAINLAAALDTYLIEEYAERTA